MKLLEPLTTEQEDIILAEVGYDREKLAKDIASVRQWLTYQHHLPPCRNEEPDAFISNYLVGCKGSIERAKQKIDAYYTIRSQSTSIFEERNPEKIIAQSKDTFTGFHRHAQKGGARTIFWWQSHEDAAHYDYANSCRVFLNMLELHIRKEPINGGLFLLIDGKNFGGGHVLRINPVIAKNISIFLQDALPYRIKGMLFFNCPSFLETAVNQLFRPFFSSKLFNRFHLFQKGPEELEKFIDRKYTAKDIGGEEPSRAELSDDWKTFLIDRKDWFLNEGSQKNDESKRPKDSKFDSYLGVQGSIKQLAID